MNVLSKILIISFISISLQSISALSYTDVVNINGVVTMVAIKKRIIFRSKNNDYITFSKSIESIGTGFFVGPHTLVTAWHVIDDFKGNVSVNLFITHPKTKEHIPVHSIRAVHSDYDLAVLHISEYESPVYYELFEGSEESLSSEEVYLFDSRDAFFPILEGTLSPWYYFEELYRKKLDFFDTSISLHGLSGSPIFSLDNKVIGVLTRKILQTRPFSQKIYGGFSNIETVKNLLLEPSLNCQSRDCVKEEAVPTVRVRLEIVDAIKELLTWGSE